MWYSFVCSSTCLALKNIAKGKKFASKFKAVACGLSHIKKITAKVAEMAKVQYKDFKRLSGKNITLSLLLLIL